MRVLFILATTMTFLFFSGCQHQQANLYDGGISLPVSISLDDDIKLTFGWYNLAERTSFTEQELAIIQDVVENFESYKGEIVPPWRNDVLLHPVGQPTTMVVNNAQHTVNISFMPHNTLGDFAYVEVGAEPGQWFALREGDFLRLMQLLGLAVAVE